MDYKERVEKTLVGVNSDVAEHLNSESMITDGILDSLDIMKLIVALEDEFDIEVDPEDVLSENFESIAAMIALVKKSE